MRRFLVACLACLCPTLPLVAATVAPLNFQQLVNNSGAVALVRVTEVRGEFIGGGRGIESVVTVEVLKGLKGAQVERLQFTVPGGRAGRYLNLIPGAPTFAPGDLAVVFLTSKGPQLPVTTGLTQGVYRVQRSGDEMMVMPPIVDTGKVTRGDVQRKPVSLAAFEASVRAVVGK
jgi:hypothetical protein